MLNLLRGYAEKLLGFASRPFLSFPPNLLTVTAFMLSAMAGIILLGGGTLSWLLSAVLLLLSGFLDMVDGYVARKQGHQTKIGSFLDSILDRYGDSFVLAGLVLADLAEAAWGLAALVGSLLVSYARAKGESLGVAMSSVGVAERGERMLLISTGLVLAFVFSDSLVIGYAVALLALLTHLTVAQRFIHVWRALRHPA